MGELNCAARPEPCRRAVSDYAARHLCPTWSKHVSVKQRLFSTLTACLEPLWLEILDESDQHAGHAGWRAEGETHLRIKISSPAFTGKSRIERHRMVNALAASELREGLHALAIEARAPGEPRFSRPDAAAIDAGTDRASTT